MIAYVSGNIIFRGDRFLIIETGGIGYKVFVTPDEIKSSSGKKTVALWTRHHIREDSQELYGFSETEDLNFFELLIQISGIGPKSALGIISIAPPETLRKAVASGDSSYLTKVSGIGRKTADKIILELKDKVFSLENEGDQSALKEEGDTLEALKSLGYSLREAREALRQVPESAVTTSEKIKSALRFLNKK